MLKRIADGNMQIKIVSDLILFGAHDIEWCEGAIGGPCLIQLLVPLY